MSNFYGKPGSPEECDCLRSLWHSHPVYLDPRRPVLQGYVRLGKTRLDIVAVIVQYLGGGCHVTRIELCDWVVAEIELGSSWSRDY